MVTSNKSSTYGTKQHSLSQELLRRFSIADKDGQVYVLSKTDNKVFNSSTLNLAGQKGHFDLSPSIQEGVTVDDVFSKHESAGNRVIKKIVEAKHLHCLTTKDRAALSRWVIVLFTASQSERNSYLDIHSEIHHRHAARGGNTFGVNETPEHAQAVFMSMVQSNPLRLAKYINRRMWILRKPAGEYVIGDSAIGRINTRVDEEYSNISIVNDEVDIVLPLSPVISLHMFTHLNRSEYVAADCLRVPEDDSIDVIQDTENETLLLNFLQMNYSERQVYACSDLVLEELGRLADRIPGAKDPSRYKFAKALPGYTT